MGSITVTLLAGLLFAAPGASCKTSSDSQTEFPRSFRVRLWYLHPPHELRIRADARQAQMRRCNSCKPVPLGTGVVRALGASVQMNVEPSRIAELQLTGAYELEAAGLPPIHADFPIKVRAERNQLLVTATMPMEEYVAAVLAGETGNFKSDEALKAMAVAARTYAVHFGSRHARDGFEFCDSTHCQDLRLGGVNPRLRQIAEDTAGEVLWFQGEPAAAYYFANCGGTTEDGRYILGNDEERAPYLTQHSDQYCVRNGAAEWRSEVSKRELQRALSDDGISVPGTLHSVAIAQRTPSGRIEFLRVTGHSSVTVPGIAFRSAVGRHIGWDRLKSNLYEVSDRGDRIVFHGRGFGHGVGLCQVGAEVMGEEGRTYRQILAFYYPGTHVGVAAQGLAWQQLANDDLELLTSHPGRDRSLLPLATRYLHAAEESTGLAYRERPRLKVYATVAEYRDATGEPGWIAASTRGRTIQVQPPDLLRQAGSLESTLRHELLHLLIESYARPGTPQWFREGLVLYLSTPGEVANTSAANFDLSVLEKSLRAPQSEQELRAAYAQARGRVAQLAQAHGREVLIDWVQHGLPPELVSASHSQIH